MAVDRFVTEFEMEVVGFLGVPPDCPPNICLHNTFTRHVQRGSGVVLTAGKPGGTSYETSRSSGRRQKKVKPNISVYQCGKVVEIQIANKPVQIQLKQENDSSQNKVQRIKR